MAQENDECPQYLSIFAENAKVKNYKAAYEPWSLVRRDCPDLNTAIYVYGERILKDRLKNSPETEKINRQNDLLKLYDDWVQYFPTKKGRKDIGNILSAKAQSMIDFKIGSNQEIYSIFDDAFKKVDVLLAPTAPTTAFGSGDNIDNPMAMYLSDLLTIPANLAGLPAISLPCGFDKSGLPIGLQLIGNVFEEGKLLQVANQFEKAAEVYKNRPKTDFTL